MAVGLVNIYKNLGTQNVFTNLNLTFEDGKFTAIMGPSGCGKTTLVNLVCGLTAPDYGRIVGVKRHKTAVVFQEDRLLEHRNALANIQYVLQNPKQNEDLIWELLTEAGLAADAHKRARDFSGGMRRRLSLVRALAYDADLVILDEPFKGLDEALKPVIMGMTKVRCAGKTVLLVTHDPAEAVYFGAKIVNIATLSSRTYS